MVFQVSVQEQIQKLHFNELVKAIGGNGVISGLEVTATSPASMNLNVSAGEATIGGARISYTATTVTIPAADPLYPRKDLVVAKDDGTIDVVEGTPDSPLPTDKTGVFTITPRPPDPPSGSIILAEVWVPAGASAIASSYITDRRILVREVAATLSALEIDVDKDWGGHVIKNLGAPVDSYDSLRKIELDTHEGKATGVHGVGTSYIAKTSRSDQLPALSDLVIDADKDWNDKAVTNMRSLTLNDRLYVDVIEEKTSGAGIDIGAGSLYVNQTLKLIRWKQKKYALYFNGENAYVLIDDPVLGSNQVTIIAFVRKDAYVNEQVIVGDWKPDGQRNLLFGYEVSDGTIRFYVGDGTNRDFVETSGFTAGVVHFMAGRFNGDTGDLKLRLDDNEVSKTTSITAIGSIQNPHPYCAIGRYLSTFFKGVIYELLIYNRYLLDSELDQIRNNPQSPPTNGLVSWWNFDEGSGDTAYDKSGNGNHGTIYNATWEEAEIYAGSRFPRNRVGLLEVGHIRQLGGGEIILDSDVIRPPQDNYGNLGTSSYRWALVRAVTVTQGDLNFARSPGRVKEKVQVGVDEEGNPIYEEVEKSLGDEILFTMTEEYDEKSGKWKLVTKNKRGEKILDLEEDGKLKPKAGLVTEDILFSPSDQPCPKCGRKFEVGDLIALKVVNVSENGEFRARPIHLKCAHLKCAG